jgi:CDP-diacylglycerol---glycerol-3-phosphate 3-phosphatidyltransferase
LVTEFGPERVEIRMYHTPNLTGLRKKYIPKRINEGWGLQHMKLYGMDDEIILSGANLSTDYFTNRQDRYHVFSSKEITDYFRSIHDAVSHLSFLVNPSAQDPAGYTLSWPAPNLAPSPLISPRAYVKHSSAVLLPLIQPPAVPSRSSSSASAPSSETSKGTNTTIYPLLSLTQLFPPSSPSTASSTEAPALSSILTTLSQPQYSTSSWTFTAGYFNPSPFLVNLLLRTASVQNTVITASQQANGFYGSKGVSGLLPPAYTLLSRRFLERAEREGRKADIGLKEWRRGTVGEDGGWTYHAKGLWISVPSPSSLSPPSPSSLEKEGVSISVVGSSNYTQRSYALDLEAGACIITSDPSLQQRLKEEKDHLGEYAGVVTRDDFARSERRVGLQVRIAMWIVGLVGGAL